MPRRSGVDRILTVPNALSLARLGLAACFVALLYDGHHRVASFVVLAVAGATDFFDGVIARRFNQVSNLGKVLDPTVDRIVLATAVIAMVAFGAIPIWLSVLVMAREVLLLVGAGVLFTKGVRRMEVLPVGKAGTFGMMVAFPVFLIGDTAGGFGEVVRAIGWVIAIPAIALSWFAALSYWPHARSAVHQDGETLQPTA